MQDESVRNLKTIHQYKEETANMTSTKKQEEPTTWEAKEEEDSSTAMSMEMFRCVWEENLKTTRNPAAAKAKSTKEKEAEAAIKIFFEELCHDQYGERK